MEKTFALHGRVRFTLQELYYICMFFHTYSMQMHMKVVEYAKRQGCVMLDQQVQPTESA